METPRKFIIAKLSIIVKICLASEKTEHMLYIWDFDVDHILSANTSAVAE